MYDFINETYYFDVFKGPKNVPNEELEYYLEKSIRLLDSAYNRNISLAIKLSGGFDKLSSYEQDLILNSTCEYANFLYDNQDTLYPMSDSYTIGDISVSNSSGSDKLIPTRNGVKIPFEIDACFKTSRFCNKVISNRTLWRR